MTWELVAVDAASGRSLLRKAGRWYLCSKAREWQPMEVDGQRAQFLAASMIRARRSYCTFEEAILEVKRICAGGPPDPPASEAWEEGSSDVISRFGVTLDRFFEARGCSVDESFRRSLEVFRRLSERGPVAECEISWLLYRFAMEICPPAPGAPSESPRSGRWVAGPRALEGVRLGRALGALDPRTLRCLYFWSVLKSGRKATAQLTRLSEDEVRSRLVEVAARLRRSIDQLDEADVVEACIRVVKGPRD